MTVSRLHSAVLLSCALFVSPHVNATVVLVKTNAGNFEINLYDKTTPVTVANFLNYVNNKSYDGTFIHRNEPGFVVQGGGFRYNPALASPFVAIPQQAAIQNEPKWSNVRATIAMAKVSGNPNSATNQWFINVADNSSNLDLQNGGFAVFGEINALGMETISNIAKLPTGVHVNFAGVPMRNYTSADAQANRAVTLDNLVVIESMTVINNDQNSAAGSTPKANTLILTPPSDSSSSAGSIGWLSSLALLWLGRRRRL